MSRKTLKRIYKDSKKYVLGDVLGEGAFGQVREGMRVDEGDKFGLRVAVKIISRRLIKKVRNGQENLKREMRCIKKVKHQNVIQLIENIDEPENDKVYLVFELANLFSLQDLCEHARDSGVPNPITNVLEKQLPIPYIKILFVQLIAGLQACHSKGVVHRDIKPSNLQLTSDGKLKIIDFGVAESLEMFSELDVTVKFAGTPSFQPPEVALGERSFSATKVDIWAAGVTLYYMVEGSAPFKGDSVDDLYSKIGIGEYKMPARADADLVSILAGVMHKEPEHRFTIDCVLKHTWCDISSIDINLTEVLAELDERTKKTKSTLMKRYMDEEADSDDESCASAAGEDDDDEKMNRDRERFLDSGLRGGLEEKNEVQKRNEELKRANMRKFGVSKQDLGTQGQSSCVVC
mmetsp:Transcript_95493/g.154038  ORF Transcript_95493/g.154038 Transcript_95493/m.154038 type:complete len:405 (-) Transcript_95493:21-1235(-)